MAASVRSRVISAVLLAAISTGCASGGSRYLARTMPNPDGCYVQVWEEPGFSGASDYVNGPRMYSDLRDLPGHRSWKNRIRSLRLGPATSAMVWSNEGFRGTSTLLTTDSQRRGYSAVPAKIESVEIRCAGLEAE